MVYRLANQQTCLAVIVKSNIMTYQSLFNQGLTYLLTESKILPVLKNGNIMLYNKIK